MSGECEKCGEMALECLCRRTRMTQTQKRMEEIEAVQSLIRNSVLIAIQDFGRIRTKQAIDKIFKGFRKSNYRKLRKL